MNIYAVRNSKSSGMAFDAGNIRDHVINNGGYHSAGVVVVAATKREAAKKLEAHMEDLDTRIDPDRLEQVRGSGVVLYCDGEC